MSEEPSGPSNKVKNFIALSVFLHAVIVWSSVQLSGRTLARAKYDVTETKTKQPTEIEVIEPQEPLEDDETQFEEVDPPSAVTIPVEEKRPSKPLKKPAVAPRVVSKTSQALPKTLPQKKVVAKIQKAVESAKVAFTELKSAAEKEEAAKESVTSKEAPAEEPALRQASDLEQQPGNPKPRYPETDRYYGKQGSVTVLGYVTEGGTIEKVQLIDNSGTNLMAAESLETFKKFRFYPGQRGWVRQTFHFTLFGSPEPRAARLGRPEMNRSN